ncbi:hypothetical protein [Corynebacterium riegelii]|uniref:hypothetical protein n=1 Tax=Corynebacterium riegelii TaxID=156976 RepID=UPI0028890A25|nr:hypothetical protein [Corynebacterium riegelii]
MSKHARNVATIAVVGALALSLVSCAETESAPETSPETTQETTAEASSQEATEKSTEETTAQASDLVEVNSGPLTIKVPKSWEVYDRSTDPDELPDPWVVGVLDVETVTQIRMSEDSGQAPLADATNYIILGGNAIAQAGKVEQRGSDGVEIQGADNAMVSFFEYTDNDGDLWNGLLLSAGTRATGNVATMELLSIRDGGLSQDEVMEIVNSATYDVSKAPEVDAKELGQ